MKESDQLFYHDLMRPNSFTEMTEIFIRHRNKIIAGISVLRDNPFQHQEVMRLKAILPVAELMTFDILPEPQITFTLKEQETIHLVKEGASNKRIALLLEEFFRIMVKIGGLTNLIKDQRSELLGNEN
ncbi:hypothetical protein [Xenorhabdus sp. PB62.4]|uniref:hypothetical protein n=1 Tax=Xenorhabdus sp. PB62.4 TaxID=1851573 RepID=UPI00165719E0|nr:hypothetical protein [Xenorhabdus sp. PB62.4]